MKKKVMIIGAGQVGSNLATKMSRENHDVVIVDRLKEKISVLDRDLDVQAICAPLSPRVLVDCGIADMDMLIAVTDIDEINLISCLIARKYGVPRTIARVNNIDYDSRFTGIRPDDFGASIIINQMSTTTDEIVELVNTPGATEIATFSERKVELVGFHVTSRSVLANRVLISLRELPAFEDHLVVAICRDGGTEIPTGQSKIKAGDKIYIIGRSDTVANLRPLMGFPVRRRYDKVMIYGGNDVGVSVAKELCRRGKKVYLLESDKGRCEELSGLLQGETIVFHSSGSDPAIFGSYKPDIFIAVSDSEEENIVSCITAKQHSVDWNMCILQQPQYLQLAGKIGIDVVISPKITTEGRILKYLRHGRVFNLVTIKGLDAEVMEIEVEAMSKVTRHPISGLRLPSGVILGAVVRNGQTIIPTGSLRLERGDRVILFHTPMDTDLLSSFFTRMDL